jgi:two-component system response regulator GlrR
MEPSPPSSGPPSEPPNERLSDFGEEPEPEGLDRAERPGGACTVAVVASAGPHALVQRMWLQVVSGPDAGALLSAGGDRAVIGTHDSANIILHDPTVSRFHCELTVADERPTLKDLGSRNGTFVDGVSILQAHLRTGSMITIGRTQLRFEVGSETVKVALSEKDRFGLMVGRSIAMRRAFDALERAAASDATVLLEGETGTGKEVAAESLHLVSGRRDGPFIIVDCGAIPSELLESELFGHEKGSFTGAVSSRDGAFQAANHGTIFLDEIGELSIDLQPKLLRVLERRQVKRVGSSRYAPVDVRVVAATNRNLRSEVNARKFRSDLYYRLAVLEVRLPPLRERPDDLPQLIEHLLSTVASKAADTSFMRTSQFLADVARHTWPGNIRELRNYLERCLAMREPTPLQGSLDEGARPIEGGEGAPLIDVRRPLKEVREAWVQVVERRYLTAILAQHEGNVRAAAQAAGVDRAYFYRLLWRHGLK